MLITRSKLSSLRDLFGGDVEDILNYCILTQWSWRFKQSYWFAISDYSTIFTSLRVDNVWARCFSHFWENDLLKWTKSKGWLFLRQEKTWNDSKRRFSIYCSWVLCSMDCLQLSFTCVEEAFSWTQRFLTRKLGPKVEVYLRKTNMKANVYKNSEFQVHRKKNMVKKIWYRESNRAAIFVSTSCKERHNKHFWL